MEQAHKNSEGQSLLHLTAINNQVEYIRILRDPKFDARKFTINTHAVEILDCQTLVAVCPQQRFS